MTGASKILTVSYGTFSCTLEGFDDPFNTMKAIAEYFRDLAAEDRYFGAEPPTPDAAMLHRIAEREIQRRVEAKVQENGIVLRAAESDAAPAATNLAMDTAPPAEVTPAAPRLIEQTPQAAESVVEKLSRLRAEAASLSGAVTGPVLTVAQPDAATAYSVPDFVAPDFGEEDDYDLPAQPRGDVTFADAAEPAVEALADLPAGDPVTDLVANLSADLGSDLSEPVSEAAAAASFADSAPGLAEKAQADDAAPTDALTDALLAGLMADLAPQAPAAPALQEDEAAPAIAQGFGTDDSDADEIDLPPSLFAEDEAEAPATDPLQGAPDGAEAVTATEVPDAVAATETAIAEAAPMAEPDAMPDLTEPSDAPAASAEAEDTPPALRADASEKLQRARARVVRIRRTDPATQPPAAPDTTLETATEAVVDPVATPTDPAIAMPVEARAEPEAAAESEVAAEPERAAALDLAAEPEAEPVAATEPEVAPAPADAPRTVLSPEAEAALAAELAALSAEAEVAAPAVPATPTDADQRRAFVESSADATISRLMAQADEHLEGPESKRRLSAIAHLKAAVAATVAERRATGDKPKDAEPSQLSRYRDDLAKVVRNTLGGGATAPQPAERPAPLVLVSEQRIDRPRPVAVPAQPVPAQQAAAPVMPRRLTGGAGLAFAQEEDELEDTVEAITDSRGFLEFADRLGAHSLGELIEASAAYLACVEGREHFTRPQLMGLVQAAMPDGDIPREDGLRSFGTLLRTGRIEKIRRGQFALSEGSTYLAEGRRIAG